jgi:hypothetical protein
LLGAGLQATTTDAQGRYGFAGLPADDRTVEPERGAVADGVVSALDAAFVLQAMVAKRQFSELQSRACDVTGNGSLSALDAARILQFVVQQIDRLPVAEACGSNWAFVPAPELYPNQRVIEPSVASGICTRGAIALEPLSGYATGQDFLGVALGDCTGNWSTAVGPAGAMSVGSGKRVRVRTERPRPGRNARVWVPLRVAEAKQFNALAATLAYDPSQLRPVDVRPAEDARGALLRFNTATPGIVNIALAAAQPIRAEHGVVEVWFERLTKRPVLRPVQVVRATVDEQVAVGTKTGDDRHDDDRDDD